MKQFSMRFKLLMVMTVVGFSGFLGLVANIFYGKNILQNEIKDKVSSFSVNSLDKIDRNLFERYGDVQAFSSSEAAQSGDAKRITKFMDLMAGIYSPIYDAMMMVDLEGKVIAVMSKGKDGREIDLSTLKNNNYAGAKWFINCISKDFKEGTSYVDEVYLSKEIANVVGGDGKVMGFSAPVFSEGKIVGVWYNFMSWKDVVEKILIEQSENTIEDEIYTVVSHSGNVLASSKQIDEFLINLPEKNAKVITRDVEVVLNGIKDKMVEGIAVSYGFSSYPGVAWRMVVRVSSYDEKSTMSSIIAYSTLFLLIIAWLFGFSQTSKISKSLLTISEGVFSEAEATAKSSNEINVLAIKIADSANQQASSVQETAAAVTQMNEMVRKSAENADRVKSVASESEHVTEQSRTAVAQMIVAMRAINNSNDSIVQQVNASNEKLGDIVKVINEIAVKAKVINEIVFQTKLLSFNASVEAARAGEHGRGFAVVAEEVGNLAQMSGKAAKEITDILHSSIEKVETIITQTKNKVDETVNNSRQKVTAGTDSARECDSALQKVVHKVKEVAGMVDEISKAASESSTGLNEISKAITQIDQATLSNSSATQDTAKESEKINLIVKALGKQAHDLRFLVQGFATNNSYSNEEKIAHSDNKKSVVKSKNILPQKEKHQPIIALNKNSQKQKSLSEKIHPKNEDKKMLEVGHDVVPSENDPRFEDL